MGFSLAMAALITLVVIITILVVMAYLTRFQIEVKETKVREEITKLLTISKKAGKKK